VGPGPRGENRQSTALMSTEALIRPSFSSLTGGGNGAKRPDCFQIAGCSCAMPFTASSG
jgi:hypothetical protein